MTKITPTPDYLAAVEGALLLDSFPGRYLLLRGRSPAKMLHGLAAGATPPDLASAGTDLQRGRAPTSALLTPKGRLITEIRVARLGNGEDADLLLAIPESGIDEVLAHLAKFLPPRFAKAIAPEVPVGSFLIVGPGAASLLAREVLGDRMASKEVTALADGDELTLPGASPIGVRLVRSGALHLIAFEVTAGESDLAALRERLRAAGAREAEDPVLADLLRIEKGRPRFGVEMDAETLPPEAGIQDRSIDHRKGCYTGQEVIVRIRDRGHVNRHLRGLLLGEADPPPAGTPLFLTDRDEAVGEVRSAIASPRFGETIALAYLRREVDPPAEVRLGNAEGPPARVRALSDEDWVLVEGDRLFYP